MAHNLNYGDIVTISPQSRHDARAFPYAILLDTGSATNAGTYRHDALLIDDIDNPTRKAYAKLYTDELTSPLPIARLHWNRVWQIQGLT